MWPNANFLLLYSPFKVLILILPAMPFALYRW